ncbi:CBS domain-containing protein [Maritimibacter alkaliphilus]|uniref:CBS domain-containing protein n=1 Tax=Maritimibacter alkaliphilus TaxID=404236 RepID=UPI001C93D5E6|nr:CBS domain-containing protein [Maritimibacter alkaliphilus]MBY6090705.1 CBS domain-containing protein [Maritimibacter alkaliphilus]
MAEITIRRFLREGILTLTPDLPMRDAVAQLVETGCSAAPVLDRDGALLGILSQKDCFKAALSSAYYQRWSDTVADHMTREVESLDADTDIVAAAERFLAEPYRSYPVTSDGALVGMLSRADLLAAFLAQG